MTVNSCRNWEEAISIVRDDWTEDSYVRKKKEVGFRKKAEMKSEEVDGSCKVNEEDLFSIKLRKNTGGGKREVMKEVEVTNVRKEVEVNSEQRSFVRRRKELSGVSSVPIRPSTFVEGPSSCKNHKGEEIGPDKGDVGSLENLGQESFDDIPWVVDSNPMAIIPYTRRIFNKFVSRMKVLGLKRDAMDEIGPKKVKRRKEVMVEQNIKSKISTYAKDLRKVKAKLRRSAKRKENIDPVAVTCNKEEDDE